MLPGLGPPGAPPAPLGAKHTRCASLRLPGPRGSSLAVFRISGMTYRQKEVIWTERDTMTECLQLFSVGEQEAILAFMDGVTPRRTCLERLLLARRRAVQRAESDAQTDVSRRLTCGARLPRETVERYRECAREHGLSLYAFTCSALEREYQRLTK